MRAGGWHPTTIFDGDAGLLRFGRAVEAAVRAESQYVPQPDALRKAIEYAITLLEVEDKDGKALQYLRAVCERHGISPRSEKP